MKIKLTKPLLLLIPLLFPVLAWAQTGTLKGVVKDENNQPVKAARVTVKGTAITTSTDSTGAYSLTGIPYGKTDLETSGDNITTTLETIQVDQPLLVHNVAVTALAGDVSTVPSETIPTVSLSEDDLKETTQNVASVLSASRDAFVSASTFVFSTARFRIRGYEDNNFLTLMNGAPMVDLVSGRSLYGSWSGLNDVMRSREYTLGLAPASYSYGDIGGVYSIDSRASHQRKQLSVSYAISNRSYDNRVMVTYGSGVSKSGWSYALSYTRRWATEGFVDGTFYDGHSYFGSLEKKLNSKHSLSLTAFGTPTKNGRAGTATKEMFDIAGTHYYNPYWGYQDGKKRNAVVGRTNQPVFILSHEWNIDEKASLETSASYQFGKYKVSGLDWYNATDPRPDYYRNWPSFDPEYGADPVGYAQNAAQIDATLRGNESLRQIQWNNLYEANQLHSISVGGFPLHMSNYILGDRVIDSKRLNFNTLYNRVINDHMIFDFGLTYQHQLSEYYKEVNDLLGGDFFVNLNQFADLTNTTNNNSLQNDLNNPNRILHQGDKYSYDYKAHINKGSAWGQMVFKYSKVDYFLALELSNTGFYRTGLYRNGVFPETSYGDSEKKNFFNYSAKGGATYKLDGRNYFFANVSLLTRAPLFENSFISARTRNTLVDGLKNEDVVSLEGGYLLRAPRLKAKAVGYYTQFKNGTDIRSYYDEDYKTFVNYSMTGIDKRHVGVELSAEATLGKGFSASAVASIGQFVYSSRPVATTTQDNKDTLLSQNETIYIKNLRLSGGPQGAYTLGLSYHSKHFWFLNANVNYFNNIYVDINPNRRTVSSLDLIDSGTSRWDNILQQTKEDGQLTVDVSGGWSWKVNNKLSSLKSNTFLVLNLGIQNLLNNKNLVAGGYEYSRFSTRSKDTNVFANRYSYAYGTTFFASIALRIN